MMPQLLLSTLLLFITLQNGFAQSSMESAFQQYINGKDYIDGTQIPSIAIEGEYNYCGEMKNEALEYKQAYIIDIQNSGKFKENQMAVIANIHFDGFYKKYKHDDAANIFEQVADSFIVKAIIDKDERKWEKKGNFWQFGNEGEEYIQMIRFESALDCWRNGMSEFSDFFQTFEFPGIGFRTWYYSSNENGKIELYDSYKSIELGKEDETPESMDDKHQFEITGDSIQTSFLRKISDEETEHLNITFLQKNLDFVVVEVKSKEGFAWSNYSEDWFPEEKEESIDPDLSSFNNYLKGLMSNSDSINLCRSIEILAMDEEGELIEQSMNEDFYAHTCGIKPIIKQKKVLIPLRYIHVDEMGETSTRILSLEFTNSTEGYKIKSLVNDKGEYLEQVEGCWDIN